MFSDLLEELKKLNLPKGKFAIFGSGPMAVKGLKEPHDLDVIVTEDVFEDLKSRSNFETKIIKDFEYLEKDGIEFLKEWDPVEWNVERLINEAEMIDGLPFVKLDEILKWKKFENREKDQKDIKLIEEYLKNRK
jgi:hypothetical protein